MNIECIRHKVGIMGRTLANELGLTQAARPQTHEVLFSTQIQNGEKSNDFEVVLPLPFEADYQHITDLELSTSEAQILEETKYGNRYAYYQAHLSPDEKLSFSVGFQAQVQPRHISYDQNRLSTFADYEDVGGLIEQLKNSYVNPDLTAVRAIMEQEVGWVPNVVAAAQMLNYYVRQTLTYGNARQGFLGAEQALAKGQVDCGGFGSVLISLLLAKGIPARLISGYRAGYSDNSVHVWPEALMPRDGWLPLDPSSEQLFLAGRSQKYARFNWIGSDRIGLSRGCDYPIQVGDREYQIDILQVPEIFASQGSKSFSKRTKFATF